MMAATVEYIYFDRASNPALKSVRKNLSSGGKEFYLKRYEDGRWVNGDTKSEICPYLYEEWRDNELIVLVEGEKTACAVYNIGLFGTTTPKGSNNFKEYFGEFFKDKQVVLIPDNDKAGRKYIRDAFYSIQPHCKSATIVELPGLNESEDIVEWIDRGGSKEKLKALLDHAKDPIDILDNWQESDDPIDIDEQLPGNVKPGYRFYKTFFRKYIPKPYGRDILSGKLLCQCPDRNILIPAENQLDILTAKSYDYINISHTKLKANFKRFESELPLKLVFDIPEWDQVDRIQQLVDSIEVNNLSKPAVLELFMNFGVGIFKRLHNPKYQNRIMILKGKQGIGKDWFIDAIFKDLGYYFNPLDVVSDKKDLLLSVSESLVMHIPEFDRTNELSSAIIKDLITKESIYLRRPYERAAQKQTVRASFIGSINVDDILRDHTGNRRFIIFELDSIKRNYPSNQSSQILSQFNELYKSGFKSSEETEQELREYLQQVTPDNPEQALLEIYDERLKEIAQSGNRGRFGRNRYSLSEISFIVEDLSKTFKMPSNRTLNILKRNGRQKRTAKDRMYVFKE